MGNKKETPSDLDQSLGGSPIQLPDIEFLSLRIE